MSILPTIDTPIYNAMLPVSKQEVKFRPYVIKEQKILLMAVESKEQRTMIDAIAQIVSNCVLSKIDTRNLPVTDVEFLFYNIRARSQSETVDLQYKCHNIFEDDVCGGRMYHKLNLLTDLEISEALPTTIQITDKIGVKLNHQKFEVTSIIGDKLTPEQEFAIVAENIDFIYDEKSSYSSKDVPMVELISWLENLTMEQYFKIGEFYANEPRIYKKITLNCKKCGAEHKLEVEDIFDFFI